MKIKYNTMTENEIKEIKKQESIPELSTDEITEILAEQEYRICLLELGVNENDL